MSNNLFSFTLSLCPTTPLLTPFFFFLSLCTLSLFLYPPSSALPPHSLSLSLSLRLSLSLLPQLYFPICIPSSFSPLPGQLDSENRPRPLNFDPEKHKVLNSELKYLYTAITRARVNVWMFDESAEARGPMFEYFRTLGLVQSILPGEEMEEIKDGERDFIKVNKKNKIM